MADHLSLVNSHLLPDLYRAVFDQAHDAGFNLDSTGKIIEANQAACSKLGCARDELLHTDIHQFHESAAAEEFSQRLQRIETEKDADFDTVLLHQDGTAIPVHIQLRSVEHDGREFILAN